VHVSMASLLPNQTIVIGGMSKEVSGTGLRVGFAAGPSNVIKMMVHINGNTSACVSLPTQKAYARFLRADTKCDHRQDIVKQLLQRRNLLFQLLSDSHLKPAAGDANAKLWMAPRGAFYFFPNITHLLGLRAPDDSILNTDDDVSLYLLQSAGVVTIPGCKFGRAGYLRIAYAVSLDTIRNGAAAIQTALSELRTATDPGASGSVDAPSPSKKQRAV